MKLSPEMEEEIKALRAQGATWVDIAEEYGTSVVTLRQCIRETFDDLGDLVKWDKDKAILQYRNGMPVLEICTQHRISASTLYAEVKARGVPRRRSLEKSLRSVPLETAIAMYCEGEYVHDIIMATGISQPTLHAELRARGIARRNRRGLSTPRHSYYECLGCKSRYATRVERCYWCRTETTLEAVNLIACPQCHLWLDSSEIDDHVDAHWNGED